MTLSSSKMVDTKMKVSMILSFFVVFLAYKAAAEQVPTILWSSQSYLQNLPPARAGHGVSPIDLQHDYLDKVITNQPQLIVLFIQDKLSLDDFSQYGDVYSDNSNGGLFSNMKASIDQSSSSLILSTELPTSGLHGNQVASYLERRVDGPVVSVERSLEEIGAGGNKLQLDKTCLIVVRLPGVEGSIEESLKNNNDIIGSVLKSLPEKADFTVLLTANRPSKVSVELPSHDSLSSGRHLLADLDDVDATSVTFINATTDSSCALYLFATGVTFMANDDAEKTVNLTAVDPNSQRLTCGNGTVVLNVKYSNVPGDKGTLKSLDMDMLFLVTKRRWALGNISVKYDYDYQGDPPETVRGSDVMSAKFMASPRKMSYHCDLPKFKVKSLDKDNKTRGIVTFTGFQIQPVDIVTGSFSEANECVGFFTAPIWMGLFTTIILTLILALAITMIMSLKTMDRFDDPKGKTISVNTAE